jgi:hypothetical protein
MPLTGRFDFQKTMTGKLVLLLEEDVRTAWTPFRKRAMRRRWRRARVMDLASPELRPLIDLRTRPNYRSPAQRIDEDAPRSEQLERAVESAMASITRTEGRVSTH